ncbi:MAG: carbohydrate kinase family protein [Candidatus Woesearchaeota archaeon]
MYDVITIGSNTYDVFVKTEAEVRQVIQHITTNGETKQINDKSIVYPVGDKILINHLDFQIGGGGTNCAVAFSKLNLKTGYIGKIGKDDNGVKVYSLLKNEDVDFLGALGDQTGFSVILDSVADDRTILTSKGCSNDLKYNELDLSEVKTKMLYCSSMMGDSFNTMTKLIQKFKKQGSLIAFNPSLYVASDKKTISLLKYLDILVFNKEEAFALSNKNDLEDAFVWLAKKVKGIIVITDGKHGVYALKDDTLYFAKPSSNLKIVETTGAGDAFASGFSAGILLNKDLKECLKRGMIEAEAVIQYYGAKTYLLSEKQLLTKLKKDKREITIKKLRGVKK